MLVPKGQILWLKIMVRNNNFYEITMNLFLNKRKSQAFISASTLAWNLIKINDNMVSLICGA